MTSDQSEPSDGRNQLEISSSALVNDGNSKPKSLKISANAGTIKIAIPSSTRRRAEK